MPALRSAHRFAVDTEVTAPFCRARAAPAPCGPRPHACEPRPLTSEIASEIANAARQENQRTFLALVLWTCREVFYWAIRQEGSEVSVSVFHPLPATAPVVSSPRRLTSSIPLLSSCSCWLCCRLWHRNPLQAATAPGAEALATTAALRCATYATADCYGLT